jgi:hypothetical protein
MILYIEPHDATTFGKLHNITSRAVNVALIVECSRQSVDPGQLP